MIKVLIVEDSATSRELLLHILSSDPQIRVIGMVGSGEEAVDFVGRNKPDAVTMDIVLPGINGLEATRRIMESTPVPIVIVSSHLEPGEVSNAFRVMEAGAVAVVKKPAGVLAPDFQRTAREIVQKVKAMSEVRLIRRFPRQKGESPPDLANVGNFQSAEPINIVTMGGSTGAPPVFQKIFSGLPRNLGVPVVVVQHIAAGFTEGMIRWLNQTTGYPVSLAADGETLRPAQIYMAPDGRQMGVRDDGTISIRDDRPEHGLKPSVSYLFRSVAKVYGRNAIGVLLSGMGRDGAAELVRMREQGALTIAQDRESSVVHGMPGEAIRMGGAMLVLNPEQIPQVIARVVRDRRQDSRNSGHQD